jgi:beta-glucosidase
VKSAKDTISFSFNIENNGKMDGDEVTQVYIKYPNEDRMPLKELKGFKRVHVVKGGKMNVQFRIPISELQKWDMKQKKWLLYPGKYTLMIGSHSQDIKLQSNLEIKANVK